MTERLKTLLAEDLLPFARDLQAVLIEWDEAREVADLPGADLHDDDLPMVVRRLAGVDKLERLVHLASYVLSDDAPAGEYVEETASLHGFTLPR